MHYLWYLKRATPDEVVRFVGPVMVVSSLLVAAGFAVLALGQSQPMRMFGSLAALAMAGAALLTFLLVPALLRRVDRPPAPGGGRLEGSA
jgi:predicted RND superfamily exporter protein